MCRTLSSKIVKTRKTRKAWKCFGCERVFEKGTECQVARTVIHPDMWKIRLCAVCQVINKKQWESYGPGELRECDTWEEVRKELETEKGTA